MPSKQFTQGERRKQVEELDQELTDLMASKPKDEDLTTDDAFMPYVVDLMNIAMKLLHFSCAVAPTIELSVKGYPEKHAIVLAHLVRVRKLYQGFLYHVANNQLELAMMFTRGMHETTARMQYLMTAKRASFRSFKLSSYKSEREMLQVIPRVDKDPLRGKVGARIRSKIRRRLKRDGITLKELKANKTWNVDGLDFRAMLRNLNRESEYIFTFGNDSHFTHGDWADIEWHHLRRDGRRFHPKLTYKSSDPRPIIPQTVVTVFAAAKYVKWAKSDRSRKLRTIMRRLIDELVRLDEIHELKVMP